MVKDLEAEAEATHHGSGGRWVGALALTPPPTAWQRASSPPTLLVMVPARINEAAEISSSKVKYSKLSSTDGGHNLQKESLPAETSFK